MIYLIFFVVVCICIAVASENSDNEKAAAARQEQALLNQQASLEAERSKQASEREELRAKQEHHAKEQQDRLNASRRPEAFLRLFAEEFPDFSNDITYAKADELLSQFDSMWQADLVQDALIKTDGRRDRLISEKSVQLWFVRKITPIISQAFQEYAADNPEEFMAGLLRAITSSSTLAGAQ